MSQLIDRSLRSKFLPFVLDKDSHSIGCLDNNMSPQLWSFRDKDNPRGKIGIVPNHRGCFKKDISFKQLFQFTNGQIDGSKELNIEHVFDNIQGIQIREYTQDTRLDAIFSLVDFFKQGYQDGGKVAEKLGGKTENVQSFQEIITQDFKNFVKNKSWNDIVDSFQELLNDVGGVNFYVPNESNPNKRWVIDFVYTMYYRLLTTTTSNIYILPFSSEHVYYGNGQVGFDTTDGFSFGGGSGLLGSIANFIAPSVNLTLTPIWRGIKGGSGVNFDISFKLFNDTTEQSIINYIFVHTLLPQNLPAQYGFLTQPPSLYDIKIEGGNRLFMCSGQFECNYKGVIRTPNVKMIEQLISKHLNGAFIQQNSGIVSKIIEDKLIKIPDVYEITMHFKSLLPNTFNNFLFQFALNSNIQKYPNTQKGIMDSDSSKKISDWLEGRADNAVELADKYKKIDDDKKSKIENIKAKNNGEIAPEVLEQINKDYSQSKQQALQEITER